MTLISCLSARYFSRYRRRSFTLSNNEKRQLLRQCKQIDSKVGLWWPSTMADYGKQSTICLITLYFGSLGTRLCVCHRRICSTRWEIDAQSFACQPDTTKQTDGTRSSCARTAWNTGCCDGNVQEFFVPISRRWTRREKCACDSRWLLFAFPPSPCRYVDGTRPPEQGGVATR